MIIQFNTIQIKNFNTIHINDKDQSYFTSLITDRLKNYDSDIRTIDVQLSDEKERNNGLNVMRCLLNTSIEDSKSLAIKSQVDNDNIVLAVLIAVDDLIASLKTVLKRKENALTIGESFMCRKRRLMQDVLPFI